MRLLSPRRVGRGTNRDSNRSMISNGLDSNYKYGSVKGSQFGSSRRGKTTKSYYNRGKVSNRWLTSGIWFLSNVSAFVPNYGWLILIFLRIKYYYL